jgi:adenylate cyclase, class 2
MEQMEVEVKFQVNDLVALEETLQRLNFKKKTPRSFERNTLYDTPSRDLLNSGRLLRLRQYGDRWVMTFKAKPEGDDPTAPHKSRLEIETEVKDGDATAAILSRLGYTPVFVYEKWRTEWKDDGGHITMDETAIGFYAELEGSPEWIDNTAPRLGVKKSDYITLSYGRLFEEWRRQHKSSAQNLTFAEIPSMEAANR